MISDESDRKRAVQDVHRSVIVEASAGTGKTSVLIDRILYLVLKAACPVPLSGIAAITFTEKAAGELKVRLRQELEGAARGPAAGELARKALGDLETAAISTIHSFAVGLLKKRPFEAEIDPRFVAMDEIQSELLFEEVWESWLERALAERSRPLERSLRAGLGLPDLRALARELARHCRAVEELELVAPPSDEEIRARAARLIEEGGSYESDCHQVEDRLALSLKRALKWLEFPGVEAPRKSANLGRKDNWFGGAQTLQRVRDFVSRVFEFSEEALGLESQRVLHGVVRLMAGELLPVWRSRKRAGGLLDFDDQLYFARDLLRRSRAARRDFQNQFKTLLMDEFQDTDPVQLEIALLLSSTDLSESDAKRLDRKSVV